MEFKGSVKWDTLFKIWEPKPKKTREERLLDWATHHHWDKKVTLVDVQNIIYTRHDLCQGLHEKVIVGIAKKVFEQEKAKQARKPHQESQG